MANKKQNSDQSKTPQNAYFLSLELENVRCFGEKQTIDFSDGEGKPKQWTIILGDNGTGKTTILQSITSSWQNQFVTPERMKKIRLLEAENKETLSFIDSQLIKIKEGVIDNAILPKLTDYLAIAQQKSEESEKLIKTTEFALSFPPENFQDFALNLTISDKNSIKIKNYVIAYGATRKTGGSSMSSESEEPWITIFDETALLLNPEEWLIRSHYESLIPSEHQEKRKKKLNKIIETIIHILPEIAEVKLGEKNQDNRFQPIVEFKTPYGWVEAKDLSLGYRTSMAWMVDFASRMFDLYPESENPLAEPAVVLIDEIDLHLHPKWQRDLLDWLSDLCPNTQFIVTTHSPLIVQSAAARDANFAVCRREGDHVVIDQSLDAVKNWRTDQILTSDLFGLETARPKEIEQDLLERQQILSKAKLSKKDENRLKEIEAKVGAIPMMENPLYDKMMDVISRASKKLEKENNNGK